jgi:N-acetyl-alpha-D-muramate 1-phosphate uridylyltransferase
LSRQAVRRAIILAAGLGERMRPLTLTTPKPLLPVAGKPLIVHHLEKLAAAGIREVAVNVCWLKRSFPEALGDGARFGVAIRYFDEGEAPLEVAGGIRNALDFFAGEPFAVVNGDVYTDFRLSLAAPAAGVLGHLVLVPNPDHHPRGDFGLECGEVRLEGPRRYTYSGIGTFSPELFSGLPRGRAALRPLLVRALRAGRLSGEVHGGLWSDVGTPERLAELNFRHAGTAGRGSATLGSGSFGNATT